MIIGIILGIILITLGIVILLGSIRTWQTKNSPNQKIFSAGKVPSKLTGFYKGNVKGLKTTWQGKEFSKSEGINVFQDGSKNYPFKTYVAKGLTDNIDVLKIDYSQNKSPWWLKYILDELVEISPGKYLGKVHITVIPGLPFTVGYFSLMGK